MTIPGGTGGGETPPVGGCGNAGNGGRGNDNLVGGRGDGVLTGGAGNDENVVNSPGDVIAEKPGGGKFAGGLGNDVFMVGSLATTLVERQGLGTDTALLAMNKCTVAENVEVIKLLSTAKEAAGSGTAGEIAANGKFAGTLNGKGGNDTLLGGSLAARLDGGMRADVEVEIGHVYRFGSDDSIS